MAHQGFGALRTGPLASVWRQSGVSLLSGWCLAGVTICFFGDHLHPKLVQLVRQISGYLLAD